MNTSFEYGDKNAYFCLAVIDKDEAEALGGDEGIHAMANTAVMTGRKACTKGAKCALKALVSLPIRRSEHGDLRSTVEVECGDRSSFCPKPDIGVIGAAMGSIEATAQEAGVPIEPIEDF